MARGRDSKGRFLKKGRKPRKRATSRRPRMTRRASPRRRTVTRRLAKRRSSTPKKPSLSKTLALAGGLTLVSGTAQAAASQAMDAASPLLATVGITTGTGVIAAAVAAKAMCSASKWWRDKWTGFCASWGFRP